MKIYPKKRKIESQNRHISADEDAYLIFVFLTFATAYILITSRKKNCLIYCISR